MNDCSVCLPELHCSKHQEKVITEAEALKHLEGCTFLPGSFDKRFVRQCPRTNLSEKQVALVWKIVYRYRRQIQKQALIEYAAARILEL